MKTIGLLGGMSWESTVSYYRALNEGVKRALGGLHSARIVLNSVDFAEIETLQKSGDWPATANILSRAAQSVESAGADFLLIGTNTMHKVAPEIQAAISIPLLHIADATAEKLKADGVRHVGLLGTRYTMEQDFYKGRMRDLYEMDVLVPSEDEQAVIHQIIFEELCLGIIRDESRQRYLAIMDRLHERGAEAIILGCTEIALLVEPEHTSIPLYDTTRIHAEEAVRLALMEL
ncbi:aspartate/glutamate racemase family protein [Marinobacter nanhaiticus D15-8W]|uniref:Aspartate/glutamate racemase family protein n=1 Tax=Marinobacter nanhaiticus D15-8W TaxID=626887 RepID=N6X5B4_9GAMM|nr:aspartate/glutamate racemase family protein [Marinobacter nanhaiticus]ENO16253.1 aspartate/glutamate racemase family protein [Marinobacter nanhaiticus D15-8W]BES72890.1 aspartate/glutamate racemase family protein [Marinobacter nanhaiticus D15-8W]